MTNYDIECKFCSEKRYNKIDEWYYDSSMEFSPAYAFDQSKDEDLPSSPIHPVICQRCYDKLSKEEKHYWHPIPRSGAAGGESQSGAGGREYPAQEHRP